MIKNTQTLGVVYGNRDFFPDALVTQARAEIGQVLGKLGVKVIQLSESDSKLGGVETLADARKCAQLFRAHRDEIDGILVVLPNFGDEKGILEVILGSDLRVPVLVQAYPDDLDQLRPEVRRDAYCGKISVCNNLVQAGVPFSLTTKHVCSPLSDAFLEDLKRFLAVCRVVKGLRRARLGAVGARPGAFNTVRYSEKLLQRYGIYVTTIDLSEILAEAARLDGAEAAVKRKLEEICAYASAADVPRERLLLMAKLGVALEQWIRAEALDAVAIQCWSSLQKNYGCNPCTLMSMLSEAMIPAACEVDVTGALTMYALQLASGRPAALADWNNNYGDHDDRCVMFHCGNWARSYLADARISCAPILGSTLGVQNTYGALEGRTPAAPFTFARISTLDSAGLIHAYVGEGEFTMDKLDTFGSRAVAHVPRLQKLMHHICRCGFEHHVAMVHGRVADVLCEALGNYLGWEVYDHCSE